MAVRKNYTKRLCYPAFTFLIITVAISCSKKVNLAGMNRQITSTITDTSNNLSDTSLIPPSSTDTAVKTYLALGDSYTIGQSVAEEERFPNQTVQLLRNESIKINNPAFIAKTGWTTGNLISALNLNPPSGNYSVVSLLIGVNNQYHGKSIDEYKAEFALLLNRAIQYAGNNKNNVFVLSIPDYSVTPFANHANKEKIAGEIDAFNAINQVLSYQSGVNYLDITAISREALDDPGMIANDGLHPSGKQYKRWAELLAPLMKSSRN
jgi:lysophospholipase L1-like esterase